MKKLSTLLMMLVISIAIFAAEDEPYKIGDPVADFTLKNFDGRWVSLSDYSDFEGVILIFTCNHCPYAKAYEDRIIELNNMYVEQGFPVVLINPNDPAVQPEDSYENMTLKAIEKGFNFPYLFDKGQKVYPLFGATRTPHVFVLSNGGKAFTLEYIGTIDNNYEDASLADEKYVEDAVNALLAGKKPEVTETKAIGCTIKVKKK